MSESAAIPPRLPAKPAPTQGRVLRRLFLTLFLRGRSSRGLKKSGAPTSIFTRLALILAIYAFVGMSVLGMMRQSVFAMSVYAHAMTFIFVGMFAASSAGEVLFNKEEGEILLHRPVSARTMLWSKIRVMLEVSFWLAGALNLACLLSGGYTPDGDWLFLPVHAVSVGMEACFCMGCVVVVYHLCLKWFGRERLEGLMTTAQVAAAIFVVLGGQIAPRLLIQANSVIKLSPQSWWVALLPPAWFAGWDDAIAGSAVASSFVLAGIAVAATGLVMWLAFVKLAGTYEVGMQAMGEATPKSGASRRRRRWLDALVHRPPLNWWLREPVSRASFLLTSAYLFRDRDVKLRIYPSLAPMMVMPFIFMFQPSNTGLGGAFGVAFAGAYLGVVPMMGLELLRYSQQWPASDIFRAAPIPGPAALCDGARRAALLVLTVPLLLVFVVLAIAMGHGMENLPLLLPGIVTLPVYSLIPCLSGKAVPLSLPTEEAKSVGRGIRMIAAMMFSAVVSVVSFFSWRSGWFWWFLLFETAVAGCVYAGMRCSLARVKWSKME